jgi:hypothetical protein
LGDISGDIGAPTKTIEGSTSTWVKIYVQENNGSIVAADIRLRATLTSPPGSNFDLRLYGHDCSKLIDSSTKVSGSDVAGTVTADGIGPGDNSYWVVAEVRHVSGTCDPSAKWTLKFEGNK